MEPIVVAVRIEVDVNGRTTPRRITMPDGQSYDVERVLAAQSMRSRKHAGSGMRYLVRIGDRSVALVNDGVWTLEFDD